MPNLKIAVYWRNESFARDSRLLSLIDNLEKGGCVVKAVRDATGVPSDTDFLLSIGGDGTFLSSAMLVGESEIPVLGVNFGRLGFLSGNRPDDDFAGILSRGEYTIEKRTVLKAVASIPTGERHMDSWPYAVNEITVHRAGAAMLGVDVNIDGTQLPTYWADGLLVATSSGSTAYSLSVGGPIVLPESKVLIISPIASHNLNVRPMIVPVTSKIKIGLRSRDPKVMFTMDNRTAVVDAATWVSVSMAQFSLNRVRLNASNFIQALTEKLHWCEDIRNSTDR